MIWKYTNKVMIGIDAQGLSSLLFQILPPGDRKTSDVVDVEGVVMPVQVMKGLHEQMGRLIGQWEKSQRDQAASVKAAADQADAALGRVAKGPGEDS